MSRERNVPLKDSFALKFKNARDLGIIYKIDYRKDTLLSTYIFLFLSDKCHVKEKISILFVPKEKHKNLKKNGIQHICKFLCIFRKKDIFNIYIFMFSICILMHT